MVFRHAGHAGIVAHRHLLELSLLKHHQRGQEAVHAVEEGQPLGVGRPHHFQRATRVGGRVARHLAAEAIGNLRLQALEAGVLAVGADAGHELVVGSVLQQQREVLRVGLQVGVNVAHIAALGGVDARLHGRAEAMVLRGGDEIEVGLAGADVADGLQAAVLGAVVDQQHAGPHGRVGHEGRHLLLHPLHVVLLVIDRHDDGQIVVSCLVHILCCCFLSGGRLAGASPPFFCGRKDMPQSCRHSIDRYFLSISVTWLTNAWV